MQPKLTIQERLKDQCHLPDCFQHGVHIVDAHICDPVNVNLGVQHETLEILVADQLRQQPVVKFARSQYFDCIITQMQSVQLCVRTVMQFSRFRCDCKTILAKNIALSRISKRSENAPKNADFHAYGQDRKGQKIEGRTPLCSQNSPFRNGSKTCAWSAV